MFHGTHIQVLNIAKCNAVPGEQPSKFTKKHTAYRASCDECQSNTIVKVFEVITYCSIVQRATQKKHVFINP